MSKKRAFPSRTSRGPLLAATFLLAAGPFSAPPSQADGLADGSPITLAFAERSVVARGLEPGDRAVFFGVAREPRPWMERVVARAVVLEDLDGDDQVELTLDAAVAPKSVWAVVELSTGRMAIDGPLADAFSQVDFTGRVGDDLADTDLVQRSGTDLEMLVVRPGRGAWRGRVSDGGPADLDGTDDGGVALAVASLVPLDATDARIERIRPGDLVVGIDPSTLEVFAQRVPATSEGPSIGGAR